jgi:hypothetical protein
VKYTFRALFAVGLLAGFYVFGLAIVVALGYVAYLLTVAGARSFAGQVWILVAVVAIAIGRGIFSIQKRTHTDPVGLLVGEAEQPELWREVRDLAESAGTSHRPSPPDGWECSRRSRRMAGIFGREDVLGIADSGLLVCRTRYLDRLVAAFALYSFRDSGPAYVKRFIDCRPADLVAESRARHVPWSAIASIAASNGRISRTMLITENDDSTWTLKWSATAHIEGEVWAALSHYLEDRFTVAS